jgi:hypothetical protein
VGDKMDEIFKKIDKLIEIACLGTDRAYRRLLYEIDVFLLTLVDKSNDIYKDFILAYQNSKTYQEACASFVSVLEGLKDYLEVKSKDRKYQFFVSSTFIDLVNYRKAIANEIIFKGHFVSGMEDFTACGEDLEKYIKREIDQSDYYILVLGQRWGSHIPGDENISYTMMEYNYAKSKNMRIIPMIYNGNKLLDGNDLEANEEKFEKFKSEISLTVPQYFKDESELIKKLAKAIDNEMKNHPQKGWVRF